MRYSQHKLKNLTISRKARTPEEAERLTELHAVLEMVAHRCGFVNYQALGIHMLERVAAEAVDAVNAYPKVHACIREVTDRFAAGLATAITKGKSNDE